MKRMPLFLFCLVYVFISSCELVEKQYEFYYYPSMNVYYDVTNKMYLYSLDGGKNWDSVLTLTTAQPATLGSRQIIKSATPDIWMQNDAHIQQYNGHPINIIAADTGVNRLSLAEERRIKKTKAANTEPDKEPEKKPGFFKRLFGKKNK